jgi:hypothetical protein
VLLGCTPDTFETVDAETDSAVVDGATGSDASCASGDGGLAAVECRVILWLIADDVTADGSAANTVTKWPDHSMQASTHIDTIANASCGSSSAIHAMPNAIQGHTAVTFCGAWLDVTDSANLEIGIKPFALFAVVKMANGAFDQTLFTKSNTTIIGLPFTLLAPTATGVAAQGNLSNGVTASEMLMTGDLNTFRIVSFVRDKSTADDIYVKIGANEGQTANATSADDISEVGADILIGALSNAANGFGGELAELVLADGTGPLDVDAIETYLKNKYSL